MFLLLSLIATQVAAQICQIIVPPQPITYTGLITTYHLHRADHTLSTTGM